MAIRDWPQTERPREKLLHHGVGSLSDAELLAIFIQTGTAGHSAVQVARDALQSFGGLSALLMAERHCFCQTRGLGDARYSVLQAALEISRRHVFETTMQGDVLSSPEHVRQYLSLHLTGLGHEVFCGLFLDNRHRVIEYRELFRGTIDSAAVYPREVVKRCLSSNAAAVIFAHNHPSGVAEPSDTDVRLTRKLVDALALIDVRVLDHLIIGQGVQTSLAERGLM
ncbi:RadC family protein [Granulosicoccus sp. 3-233]|uniref:RadC family protein n=1 Tax=Granulosicoccus sp. 3-233 TaxID=3417969 RepID=UPI003D3398CB